MKKRIFSAVLTVIIAAFTVSAMCLSVSADNVEYGIIIGGVQVTSDNLTIDAEDTDSGITSGSMVYDAANGTLTLNNVTAEPQNTAAIHIKPGTKVDIVLVGNNTLTGATGCAGIFVEAGRDTNGDFSEDASAKVTFKGEGSLTANGGDALHGDVSGGAGIGGNGFGGGLAHVTGGDFGVIVIESGNIIANGGDDDEATYPYAGSDYGAGAGIGGGGVLGSNMWTYCGHIEIKGGTVVANGGNGYSGGAGIGSGSAGSSYGTSSEITTVISCGDITATGGKYSAGIGGGGNGASGPITISGGTVIATGSNDGIGDASGGAGIGGGDNAENEEITICGNAVVTAIAGGAAAGIGGGSSNISYGSINIEDTATVTAIGGSAVGSSGVLGGAGIGSGKGYNTNNPEQREINISTTGRVIACAGTGAQALGSGTKSPVVYTINIADGSNDIWMLTQSTDVNAYDTYDYNAASNLTVYYTLSDGETYPSENTSAVAKSTTDGVTASWKFTNNKLTILDSFEVTYPDGYKLGNWAAVLPPFKASVTYEWNGDVPAGDFKQKLPDGVDEAAYGSEFDVDTTYTADTVIDHVVDGIAVGKWVFSGWDKTGTIVIKGNTVISGTWYYESYIAVEFDKSVDENGDFIEARGERVYDIKLVAYNGKDINRLNSVDLSFILDSTYGSNAYEIVDIAGDNITVNPVDDNRYEFHFETKTNVTNDTAASITLARVKFTGYGAFTFVVNDSVTTNAVHATKLADNIVDTYVPGGVTSSGKKAGTLVIEDFIDDEIFTPVQTLKVNIAFSNRVEFNKASYQKMNVTVTGTDIETVSVDLGTDNDGESITADHKPGAEYSVAFDNDNCVCTVEFTGILTANTTYTVYVSGAGYRTARYTVTMTDDKVLNFWNNVKDNEIEVEEGKSTSAAVKNFLAGDIVGDNQINIYDLSAVVSYFATEITNEADYDRYIKYDLNRDGKIDSADVAYVLVSWGK